MPRKPKAPDNRKPLGELKRQLTADQVSMLRTIARLFKFIAEDNPQAVLDAMKKRGAYLSTLDDVRLENMRRFYHDNAEWLVEFLDIK